MKNQHYKNIGVVLIVMFAIAYFTQNKYVFFGTLAVGIILMSFEKLAILFSDGWMKFGKFLGDINARIILTIFFIFIINPIALLKKIFGTKNTPLNNTNWQKIEEETINFKNPW